MVLSALISKLSIRNNSYRRETLSHLKSFKIFQILLTGNLTSQLVANISQMTTQTMLMIL